MLKGLERISDHASYQITEVYELLDKGKLDKRKTGYAIMLIDFNAQLKTAKLYFQTDSQTFREEIKEAISVAGSELQRIEEYFGKQRYELNKRRLSRLVAEVGFEGVVIR